MNSCLADLSRLIPTSYSKKGRGRIEKTEIIEMAIKHMKHLQNLACQGDKKDRSKEGIEMAGEMEAGLKKSTSIEFFRVGYHECLTELMHFLVEKEGLYSGDAFCVRLMGHLQKHYDKLGKVSTSEIHSTVNKAWSGQALPSATSIQGRDSQDENLKSEKSDESGYVSNTKNDEEEVVNLTVHHESRRRRRSDYSGQEWDQGPASAPYDDKPEDVEEGAQDEDRGIEEVARGTSGSPLPHEKESRYQEERLQSSDQPSDLSKKMDVEASMHLYKFKSNIRQRFSLQDAPLDEDQSSPRRESVCSDGGVGLDLDTLPVPYPERYASPRFQHTNEPRPCPYTNPVFDLKHEEEPEVKLSPSPSPAPVHPSPLLHSSSKKLVPIFALNARGTYYIPMTVDIAVINPILSLYLEESNPVLHPVNISVNYKLSTGIAGLPLKPAAAPRSGVIQQPSVIKNWREQTNM